MNINLWKSNRQQRFTWHVKLHEATNLSRLAFALFLRKSNKRSQGLCTRYGCHMRSPGALRHDCRPTSCLFSLCMSLHVFASRSSRWSCLSQHLRHMFLDHRILPFFHVFEIMQKIRDLWVILARDCKLENLIRRWQSIHSNGHHYVSIWKLVANQILALATSKGPSDLLDCFQSHTAFALLVFIPILESKDSHCHLHDDGDQECG